MAEAGDDLLDAFMSEISAVVASQAESSSSAAEVASQPGQGSKPEPLDSSEPDAAELYNLEASMYAWSPATA